MRGARWRRRFKGFDRCSHCDYVEAAFFLTFRSTERPSVTKPDLGLKRLCPSCGAKYYDLNRDPILCPRCGAAFDPHVTSKARAAKAVAEEDEEDLEEDDVVGKPEFVSLEEADAENGDDDDIPDIDDAGIEEDDDTAEDTFLEDDEDEGDDVTGIIGGGVEDDEER